MAFSNIFGSNALMVALLFVSDLLYRPEPVLREAERSVEFAAALGVAVTCVYLWGLLERADRTIWRIGLDSATVLLYLTGLAVLYTLR